MSPSREQKYGNSALILLYATRVEGMEKGKEVKRREGEGGGGGGGGGGRGVSLGGSRRERVILTPARRDSKVSSLKWLVLFLSQHMF